MRVHRTSSVLPSSLCSASVWGFSHGVQCVLNRFNMALPMGYCPSGTDCSCMRSSPWRLLSSCSLRFLQAACFSVGSPQVAACCDVVSSVARSVDICSDMVLFVGFSGTTRFTKISPPAVGESLLWHLENLLPLLH